MPKVSVIITNWNGLPLLKKYLIPVCQNSPEASEIILADDASQDSSLEYAAQVQKKYPLLRIISHRKNIGFGRNSNQAVKSASGDYVVLLNSDILPHDGYISSSLRLFKKPNIFGVSFSELGHENWARIYWGSGYFQDERGEPTPTPHITGWVSGGSSIVDRSKFLKLGGFDDVYEPFYAEDKDLGFRAWRSGYTLMWDPKSIVEHRHESTTSKFPRRFLDYVKERNRLLTVWRNITDPTFLLQNKWTLVGRVLSGPNYIKIIRAASRQIKSHSAPIVFPILTDREVFGLFSPGTHK